MRTNLLLQIWVILASALPCTSQILETRPFQELSNTDAGSCIAPNQFLGFRFQVASPVTMTSVGGEFLAANSSFTGCFGNQPGSIFAALVMLSGPTDFPDSIDLSTSDVIGTTLLHPGTVFSDVSAPLFATLQSGYYGLLFGSGLFGADGVAGAGFVDTTATIGLSGMYITDGRWYGGVQPSPYRFFVVVPEPTALHLVVATLAVLTSAHLFRLRRFRSFSK